MRTFKGGSPRGWPVALVGLCTLVLALAWPVSAQAAGPWPARPWSHGLRHGAAVKMTIAARNTSIADTALACGTGEGSEGDRLTADVSVDSEGVVTGWAKWRSGLTGESRRFNMISFAGFDIGDGQGGVVMTGDQVGGGDPANIVLWFNQYSAPAHVTIEHPAGDCVNSLSTFTNPTDHLG